MTVYLYPQDLKAKASLWLWSLRDFTVLCIAAVLSAAIGVYSGLLFPGALTLAFGFLTIRAGDNTVLDNLGFALRYCLTVQQYYEWR